MDELLDEQALPSLLHDPYGNYVLQRTLAVGSPRHLSILRERVKPHLPALRTTLYGKRIHAKLVRHMPDLANATTPPV